MSITKRAFCLMILCCAFCIANAQHKGVLSSVKLKNHVAEFNRIDTETVKNYVTNDKAYDWLAKNVPLFECPDSAI